MLSVIMATKNRAAQIEKSLWSWRHQNFDTDIELIVVNDGSYDRDELVVHCKNYGCVLIDLEGDPNRNGPSIAWNVGLREAKGDVLALTHPEIIPDFDCARVLYGSVIGDSALCDGYRLWTQNYDWTVHADDLKNTAVRITLPTYRFQADDNLDSIAWKIDPKKFQSLYQFWDKKTDFGGLTNGEIREYLGFFWNNLFAMHSDVWKWMNYLTPQASWGIDDTDLQNRDRFLKLVYVHVDKWGPNGYHQWHSPSFRGGVHGEKVYLSEEEARLVNIYPDTTNTPCPKSRDLPPFHIFLKMSNPLFHYDNILNDVSEYFNISKEECLDKGQNSLKRLADKWNFSNPQTENEILSFYETAEDYIFDLMYWHHTSKERRDWTHQIYKSIKPFGLNKVLDYGGGIGSDLMVLSDNGVHTTYTDVFGPVMKFAMWRCHKHCIPMQFFAQPQELGDHYYDLIIMIDVIEHLGNDWVIKLEKLLKHTELIAITAPFQNLRAPNEYQPQHFPQGEISLKKFFKGFGWSPVGWNLFWATNSRYRFLRDKNYNNNEES